MYCKQCGCKLEEGQRFCQNCGVQTEDPFGFESPAPRVEKREDPVDTGRPAWLVLGLFFPVVGLVLYIVWRRKKPLTAKKLGLGAIIGAAVSVACYVAYIVLVIVGATVGSIFLADNVNNVIGSVATLL